MDSLNAGALLNLAERFRQADNHDRLLSLQTRPSLDHRAQSRPTVLSLNTLRASGPKKCKQAVPAASREGKAALLQHGHDFGFALKAGESGQRFRPG
jgi:hypothetical protein